MIPLRADVAAAYGRLRGLYDALSRISPPALERRLSAVEKRTESLMSASSDAYARLDEQIEALRAYVVSDDETDAAEVDRRADEIKGLLAEVRTDAEPEQPAAGDAAADGGAAEADGPAAPGQVPQS